MSDYFYSIPFLCKHAWKHAVYGTRCPIDELLEILQQVSNEENQ